MVFSDSGSSVFRVYVADDFHNYAGIYLVIVYVSIEYAVFGVFGMYLS